MLTENCFTFLLFLISFLLIFTRTTHSAATTEEPENPEEGIENYDEPTTTQKHPTGSGQGGFTPPQQPPLSDILKQNNVTSNISRINPPPATPPSSNSNGTKTPMRCTDCVRNECKRLLDLPDSGDKSEFTKGGFYRICTNKERFYNEPCDIIVTNDPSMADDDYKKRIDAIKNCTTF